MLLDVEYKNKMKVLRLDEIEEVSGGVWWIVPVILATPILEDAARGFADGLIQGFQDGV